MASPLLIDIAGESSGLLRYKKHVGFRVQGRPASGAIQELFD